MKRILAILTITSLTMTQGARQCSALEVWTGPKTTFSKAASAEVSQPANQDRITDNVWITRGDLQGIYNIKTELGYADSSPADTEWAWDLAGFNTGLNITATNYQNLTFSPWKAAHGGPTSGPLDTVGIPGVLHLISDDIYIDIKFLTWGQGFGSGGNFSYERSTPVPEPATVGLGLLGLALAAAVRRRC